MLLEKSVVFLFFIRITVYGYINKERKMIIKKEVYFLNVLSYTHDHKKRLCIVALVQ